MADPSGLQPLVLIVDDDERIIDDLRFYLEVARFQVIAATTCATALEQLRSHSPILLILDVALNDDEDAGFKLCRTIRAGGEDGTLARFKDLPIVIITARTAELDRQTGLEAGADIYLSKPIRRRELVEQVIRLLE